jgi:hypothetical protein
LDGRSAADVRINSGGKANLQHWRVLEAECKGWSRGKLDTKPEELGQCMADGGQEWLMV